MKKNLITVLSLTVLVFFLVVLVPVLFSPVVLGTATFTPGSFIFYSISIVLILVGLAYFLHKKKHPKKSKKQERTIKIQKNIALAVVLSLVFVIIYTVAYAQMAKGYAWDYSFVLDYAQNSASGTPEKYQIDAFVSYVSHFSNNLGIFYLLFFVFKVSLFFGFTNLLFVSVLLCTILVFATLVLLFFATRRLFGEVWSYVALALGLGLFGISNWVPIAYTDTLGVVFPIAILYIYIVAVQTNKKALRYSLVALFGLLAAASYFVKPTLIFVPFMIILAQGIVLMRRKSKMNIKIHLLLPAGLMLVGGLLFFIPFKITTNLEYKIPGYTELHKKEAMSIVEFLAMGTMRDPDSEYAFARYGGFNMGFWDKLHQAAPEDRHDISKAIIQKNINPIDEYVVFVYKKANWILGDGTFFANSEGTQKKVVYICSTQPCEFVRNQLGTDFRSENHQSYRLFLQIIWGAILLLVLLNILVFVINPSMRSNIFLFIIYCSVGALVLFTSLFEARSRYLFIYLPLFIVFAVSTLYYFQQSLDWFKKRRKS